MTSSSCEPQAGRGRLDAKGLKKIAEDPAAVDGAGHAAVHELGFYGGEIGTVSGDVLEGLVVALIGLIPVGGVGSVRDAEGSVVAVEVDELVGLREGQRAEEQSVDDAEDDDVGTDAEGEDEDGDDGEAAVAGEGAEGVAEVLQETVLEVEPSSRPRALAGDVGDEGRRPRIAVRRRGRLSGDRREMRRRRWRG